MTAYYGLGLGLYGITTPIRGVVGPVNYVYLQPSSNFLYLRPSSTFKYLRPE